MIRTAKFIRKQSKNQIKYDRHEPPTATELWNPDFRQINNEFCCVKHVGKRSFNFGQFVTKSAQTIKISWKGLYSSSYRYNAEKTSNTKINLTIQGIYTFLKVKIDTK